MKKLLFLVVSLMVMFSVASALNFTVVGELPYHTQMHGLAVANGYIYVIAGNNEEGDTWRVLYGSIDDNGNIGTFDSPSSMFVVYPSNDSGANPYSAYIENACFAIGSSIYRLGGGWNAPTNPLGHNNADAIWAIQNPDGSLGSWSRLSPFPTGDGSGGMWGVGTYTIVNGTTWVYNCGGQLDVAGLTDIVYRSRVDDATGALLGWSTAGPPMPFPNYFNASYASNTHLYVWSGMTVNATPSSSLPNMFHASINPDGSLSSWDQISLPSESDYRRGPGVKGNKHAVYMVGGRRQVGAGATTYPTSIWKAVVNPSDGSLGTFTNIGDYVVGNTTTGCWYTPVEIVQVGLTERLLIAGARFSSTDSSTLLAESDTYVRSSGVFLSDAVYTLPSIAGAPTLLVSPNQVITISVNDGTSPYGSWISSNASIGSLSGIGGNTAVFTTSTTIGSTVVSVSDAYGDIAAVTILVSPTSAPVLKEVEISGTRIREILIP